VYKAKGRLVLKEDKISIAKIQCYKNILEACITKRWRKMKKRAKEIGSNKSLLWV